MQSGTKNMLEHGIHVAFIRKLVYCVCIYPHLPGVRQGAEGWCTGITQGMGWVELGGGGLGWETRSTPMADSCQCDKTSTML